MREMRAAAARILDQHLGNLGEMENGHTEVTKALGSEGGSHHTTTDPSGSKLGRDDGREWVVTTDTNTHLDCSSVRVLERKPGKT